MQSNCAKCPYTAKERICRSEKEGKYPEQCPTVYQNAVVNTAKEEYLYEEINTFAVQAAKQEAACYKQLPGTDGMTIPQKPRIQETVEFCQRMNYKRIGLAFCAGFHTEAKMLTEILEINNLDVVSVVCKAGGVAKEFIGLEDKDKIIPGQHETLCHSIGQAMILNKAQTDFNLIMGLCVGHDSLFLKYSKALCSVVAVKDRLMGHNPLAALYSGYYAYLKQKPLQRSEP